MLSRGVTYGIYSRGYRCPLLSTGYTDPLRPRVCLTLRLLPGMPACSSGPGLWVPGRVGGVRHPGGVSGVRQPGIYGTPAVPGTLAYTAPRQYPAPWRCWSNSQTGQPAPLAAKKER